MENFKDKLYKKALGFTLKETSEEYQNVEGQLQLTKKKITTKQVPPDLAALKLLSEKDDYQQMDDRQLEEEREKLLEQLTIWEEKERKRKQSERAGEKDKKGAKKSGKKSGVTSKKSDKKSGVTSTNRGGITSTRTKKASTEIEEETTLCTKEKQLTGE